MYELPGVGLGLKRELLASLQPEIPAAIEFLEIAPENWMEMGGESAETLAWFSAQRPVVAHGLSLSLGGPTPLDTGFLKRVGRFLDKYKIDLYTEHLSYCSDDGHLYDLLPIPFTEEAVHYVAARIRQTQDILQRRIAIENASFYLWAPINEMDEITFVNAVLSEADCDLHLDVNNVYVNSVNHQFNAKDYLKQVPAERVVYLHVAGHYKERDDLLIDTHGAAVIDPVWDLLDYTYRKIGVKPTTLERDFNIPPLKKLLREIEHIHTLQKANAA